MKLCRLQRSKEKILPMPETKATSWLILEGKKIKMHEEWCRYQR
jgi:hypothetical protein